jgi:H+-translocating NAD(P) transhydrogenase subunit alpha
MIVGVPVESFPGEQRVAIVPSSIPNLSKIGLEVVVERGAGEKAGFTDTSYQDQGARILNDRSEIFSSADLLAQARWFGANSYSIYSDLELLHSGQIMLGLFNPLGTPEVAQELAARNVTSFALELLPRITRAQPMDALSSMGTIAGYKAVLLAAHSLKKMFPMMITAAGTITPAKVFVIGAGVAGLQAIATARRLGGVVQAYDVRPAVKEQVESLGARFVEMDLKTEGTETTGGYARTMDEDFYNRQRELMTSVVFESDAVISTAAVPGKKSPILITRSMVHGMRPGSVIVDLAAEGGGNCELTRPGETVEIQGVTIIGPTNISSTIPHHASQMYSKNITAFLQNLIKNGNLNLNMEDQIIRDTLLTHNGEVVNRQVRELLSLPATSG